MGPDDGSDPELETALGRGPHRFQVTQGYIDRGRMEARRIGKPLPPLPSEVLEEPQQVSSGVSPFRVTFDGKYSKRLRTQRELKCNLPGESALELDERCGDKIAGLSPPELLEIPNLSASGEHSQPKDSTADEAIERRIVEAELAGRRTVADALARQLDAPRLRATNVVSIADGTRRRSTR